MESDTSRVCKTSFRRQGFRHDRRETRLPPQECKKFFSVFTIHQRDSWKRFVVSCFFCFFFWTVSAPNTRTATNTVSGFDRSELESGSEIKTASKLNIQHLVDSEFARIREHVASDADSSNVCLATRCSSSRNVIVMCLSGYWFAKWSWNRSNLKSVDWTAVHRQYSSCRIVQIQMRESSLREEFQSVSWESSCPILWPLLTFGAICGGVTSFGRNCEYRAIF